MEKELYEWIVDERKSELGVSTQDIIEKSLNLEPEFKTTTQLQAATYSKMAWII